MSRFKVGDKVRERDRPWLVGFVLERRWVRQHRYWRCEVDIGNNTHLSIAESELEPVEANEKQEERND